MSMVIGKEAREAIYQLVHQSTQECSGLLEILDRCTHPPEVGLPDVEWEGVVTLMRWAASHVVSETSVVHAAKLMADADAIARWLESAGQKEPTNEQ